MNKYPKFSAFKNLMAHTMATATSLLPTAAIMCLISGYPFLDNPQNLKILFVASGLILSIFQLTVFLASLIEGKALDSTQFKPIKANFWKKIIDLPEVKKVQKEQAEIILKLRRGIVDDAVINTYFEYKNNMDVIESWKEEKIKHASSRVYSYWSRYVSKSDAENNLNLQFDFIIAKVESLVDKEKLKELSTGRVKTDSLNLDKFHAKKVDFALSNGYNKLSDDDYKQLGGVLQKGDTNVLNSILKYPACADWSRVRELIISFYPTEDYSYDKWMTQIAGLSAAPTVSVTATVLATISHPRWSEFEAHYNYVVENQHKLDATEVQQFKLAVVNNTKLIEEVQKQKMSPESHASAKELIDENFLLLLSKAQQLRANIESGFLKQLSINQKHLKL